MELTKEQFLGIQILIAFVTITSIGLIVGVPFLLNQDPTNNNSSDDNSIFKKPQLSASVLEEQAGITKYFDSGQNLDLSIARSELKIVEKETLDYIVGSLALPNLTESDDVHCLVHKDGWIVCYYLKQEPTSKIVDWNFYSDGVLEKTKLQLGLEVMADAYLLTVSNANYYHYYYQNANKYMIIIEETDEYRTSDSFILYLPTEFTYYETSWGLNGESTKYGAFSGELSPGSNHTITVEYIRLGGPSTGYSYNYYLDVDGTNIDIVGDDSEGHGRVAIVLVYYEP
ncbi:MAG: hypothetical protein ACQERB_14815 [Promethearchaeati archaeon]